MKDPYAPTPERALMMARAMEREANSAIEYRCRPKGGQQVGFHGDFASAPPSTLHRIKWWTREIRRCLGDTAPEVTDDDEPASPPADETATGGDAHGAALRCMRYHTTRGGARIVDFDLTVDAIADALSAKTEPKPSLRAAAEGIVHWLDEGASDDETGACSICGLVEGAHSLEEPCGRLVQALGFANPRESSPPAPTPTDEPGKAGGARCDKCNAGSMELMLTDNARGPIYQCDGCGAIQEGTGQSAEGTGADGWSDERCAREATRLAMLPAHQRGNIIDRALRCARNDGESRGAERGRKEGEAERVRLLQLLDRDRTGLAAALGAVVEQCSGSWWITEGRGSYEWDDKKYQDETRLFIERTWAIAGEALKRSGIIAQTAFHPNTPNRPTFAELESKLAAAEKERDEAREQAAEYEQMRLDERTALGPQLRELTAARDALSKKVEAALVELRGVQEAIKPDTVSTYEAGGMLFAAVDNVVSILEADFRPGEREAKGEAR